MSAVISSCGLYRMRLEREVQDAGLVAALFGINPSTADAIVNDATIRKDIGFARVHGWRRIIKGNVFAYRATDVGELGRVIDPIGPENAFHLVQIIADADVLIPCWGGSSKVPKHLRGEFSTLLALLLASGKPVLHFGTTRSGDPLHPLYLPYETPLIPWSKP